VTGEHHVDLFFVIISALCIRSMHSVMTPALRKRYPISFVILDWTRVSSRDVIGNSIFDAVDMYNVETILLK